MDGWWTTGSERAVSEVVGFALLLALVIGGATVVVAIGSVALNDIQEQASADRASNAMTQFDSQVSRVALGASPSQRIHFGRGDAGTIDIAEDTGRVRVISVNDSGTHTTLVNDTFGAVRYETGESVVAYQGGGVWRHRDGYTRMVSVPEFHYRNGTLTFPIVRVTGTAGSASTGVPVTVSNNGTTRLFPNGSAQNPLRGQEVRVAITSRYHDGWYRFLTARTDGSVDHDPENETVAVTLTVPVTERFEYAVAATSNDSDAIETNGNARFAGPTKTGVDRPSPDREIEQRIDDCEAGNCDDLSGGLDDDALENGTYYADGSVSFDSGTEFDTANGDVTLVVNGSVTFENGTGGPGNPDQSITGNNGTVTIYMKGDLTVDGNAAVNSGGDPSDLLVLMHSGSDSIAAASGTPQFTGLIYAPDTDLAINGGGACGASGGSNNGNNGNGNGGGNSCDGNIVGSVVVETAFANGNGKLTYDSSMSMTVEFEGINDITYLHVTENRIDVTSEG